MDFDGIIERVHDYQDQVNDFKNLRDFIEGADKVELHIKAWVGATYSLPATTMKKKIDISQGELLYLVDLAIERRRDTMKKFISVLAKEEKGGENEDGV